MPSLMKARSGVLNSNIGGNALAPLFSTGSLTTANLITDVTRLAGVEGDGAAYPDSSVGVWPAATNLLINGAVATNTTGWAAASGFSIERVTAASVGITPLFGNYVLKVTCTGAGAATVCSFGPITLTAAVHRFSTYLWMPAAGWSGTNLRMSDGGTYASATGTKTVSFSQASTGVWQRASFDITPDAGDLSGSLVIATSGTPAVGETFYICGAQATAGPIDYPYIHTDGGTASRSAPTISTSFNGVTTSGWVAMRLRAGRASTVVNATDKILFTLKESTNVRFEVAEYAGNGDRFYTRAVDAGGTSIVYLDVGTDLAGSFAVGDAQTIIGYWANGGNIGLSHNGSNFATAANTRTISAPTELFIGQWHLGAYNPAVDYKWLAVGKGTLSNADAALLHAFGNNDPLPHMFPKSAQLSFLAHFNGDGTFYRRSA